MIDATHAPAALIAGLGWSEVALVGAGFLAVAALKLCFMAFGGGSSPHRLGDEVSGAHGTVKEWSEAERCGFICVDGELWKAASKDAMKPGDPVAVTAMKGLTLSVKRRRGEK